MKSEPEENKCVHTEHCCILHGCKYGDADCPVENGRKKQSYLCEGCNGGLYQCEHDLPDHKCWELVNNRIIEMNKQKKDSIYIVERLQDLNEGRGPYVMQGGGYFDNENEAWAYADTLTGVQGRRPNKGTWRDVEYGDVHVRTIHKHDSTAWKKKAELEKQIKEKQMELRVLEMEMHKYE